MKAVYTEPLNCRQRAMYTLHLHVLERGRESTKDERVNINKVEPIYELSIVILNVNGVAAVFFSALSLLMVVKLVTNSKVPSSV